MKKALNYLCLGVMALGMFACDNRPQVAGEWEGKYAMPIAGANVSDINATYKFDQNGKVDAEYQINFSSPLDLAYGLASPCDVSVSANSSISGDWRYVQHEDDEISLNFDESTLKVNVDPQQIIFSSANPADGAKLDSMRTALAQRYEANIAMSIKSNASKVIWKDVEVKRPDLRFEINDVDYTFSQKTK